MSCRQGHDEDGSAEDARKRRTISSVVEIAELFGGLEDLASECQVSDALPYLRSAQRAFSRATDGRLHNAWTRVTRGSFRVRMCGRH